MLLPGRANSTGTLFFKTRSSLSAPCGKQKHVGGVARLQGVSFSLCWRGAVKLVRCTCQEIPHLWKTKCFARFQKIAWLRSFPGGVVVSFVVVGYSQCKLGVMGNCCAQSRTCGDSFLFAVGFLFFPGNNEALVYFVRCA